jgi:hypothetical protein
MSEKQYKTLDGYTVNRKSWLSLNRLRRDRFAAQAMQALLVSGARPVEREQIARDAWALAEAMLEADELNS